MPGARARWASMSFRGTPASVISPTLGSRSAGPATTVKVSDSAESPSTCSRMRSPTWKPAGRFCAVTALASNASTTVSGHHDLFIRQRASMLDHLRAGGRGLFFHGLVARQVVGIVGVVPVGSAARDVVQHRAEQPDRQAVQYLEFCPDDVAVTVPRAQHDHERARHRSQDEWIDSGRERRAVDQDYVKLL